ncbi:MAG: polyprenol monophosphomannose synthase [Gemmatales bacterium]|nr:polyprenol monophosphomannose synthase [Gemmatales bacterium]MDW8385481.1 polyprenol monophosphomannose synthase [Gemmatales bacterium]
MSERTLVSLATYNEKDNLEPLVSEIHRYLPEADVLIIDDNSPDGTGQLADQLAAKDRRIHVLHRPGKMGLGTATIAAMRYAIEKNYDFLINMDADFSHHPRYLPDLYGGMKDRDVMIGSRYVPGGGVKNWPWKRAAMSWGVNVLSRVLFCLPVHDTSGAFRCYRVSLLSRLPLHRIWSRGYSFQEEVLYRCRKAGARFGETPIIFEDRRAGSSKVNVREAVRSLTILCVLGVLALLGLD